MDKVQHTAAGVLKALDDLGAINIDTLVGSADKIRDILSTFDIDDPDRGICYPFVIRIGPNDFDLVSVAAEVKQLGFELTRVAR